MKYTFGEMLRLLKEYTSHHLPKKHKGHQGNKSPHSDHSHLQAAMDWLCEAQDGTKDDGVSQTFLVRSQRWAPSYPETTGYIIPTFFSFALTGDETYRQRAIRMADWEIEVQHASGGVLAGALGDSDQPTVFNTGQVLFGWARAFEETGDERYRQAAIRAADWLCSIQDQDGCWRQYGSPMSLQTDKNKPNTYNTRSAWGLLRVYQITDNKRYRQGALQNARWAVSQAQENGWLNNNCLQDDQQPYTHTIAYAMRGLQEIGHACQDNHCLDAAIKIGQALADYLTNKPYLPGRFNAQWQPTVKWSCLTGNVQMAINWQRLYQITGDDNYRQAATKAINYNKHLQLLTGASPETGGIAGSHPINGGYHPWQYPNWAAKFFADALLLKITLDTDQELWRNDG